MIRLEFLFNQLRVSRNYLHMWMIILISLQAKEKQPTIIFIDEIDAIGTKRFDSEKAGDREVQRTMLELLSQLDGFEECFIVPFDLICTKISAYKMTF